MREDVPWQSPIEEVQNYCETEIPTNEDWHIPANEADGYFDDNLRILALPAIFLYNQAQEGMNLITVNPHDWYVGVGSEGNLSGGEEQIAGNRFVVHITEYSQNPTTISIKFTVSYQVTLN